MPRSSNPPTPAAGQGRTSRVASGHTRTRRRGPCSARARTATHRHRQPRKPAAPEEQIRVSAPKLDKTIRLAGEVIAAQKRAEMRQADLRRASQLAKEHWRLLRALLPEDEASAAEVLATGRRLRDHLDAILKQNREDVANLSQVVVELQEDALGLRMLPVSTVFDTFPRAMRDLARERGKEIDLVVQGARPSWTSRCWSASATR